MRSAMPTKTGFNVLVSHRQTTLRCIWCSYTPPLSSSEKVLECHARKHKGEALEAQEASRREREMAVEVLKV